MINDVKFAFRCMKYGSCRIALTISSVIFVLLGIANIILTKGIDSVVLGNYCINIIPMMLVQLYQNANSSSLVASSARKREMQTRIPAVLNLFFMLILYTVTAGVTVICAKTDRIPEELIGNIIMMNGVMFFILSAYIGIAFKKFILSIVLFTVCFLFGSRYLGKIMALSIPVPVGIALGLVCVFVGAAAHYGLNLLFYKLPIDRKAVESAWTRQM